VHAAIFTEEDIILLAFVVRNRMPCCVVPSLTAMLLRAVR